MLSHPQFFQLKRLLKDNIREVECPCGIRFYTCNTRAIYHSNACRQHFFRIKQSEVANEEPSQEQVETTEIQQAENETLNLLFEKNKINANKLKSI